MMCGLIDLNTINDNTEEVTTSLVFDSPSSSDSYASPVADLSLLSKSTASSSTVVCSLELWHACAGPLISLPKRGNAVVYLPQGHLEVQRLYDSPSVAGVHLPPHVFCSVIDVKLHAELGTDDVFAQVSLIPESQLEKKLGETEVEEDDNGGMDEKSSTPHMFCKTLTASDTSTHGGFSVPRRAAEDCFPPLDYKQQRPSQEIVAKDLHGTEWKFRHIYRGQPRRHLLTTGWSAFINKKKLVCGDAVLFLRGEDGVLRIGVRRAVQLKTAPGFPATCGQVFNNFDFTTIVDSISQKSVFNVCYNPRGRLSEFIVPYHQFLKSLANKFSPGIRFNLRFETEDAAERRSTGIITGISDIDPVNWPGSKWRCLMVNWDGVEVTRQNRVSPWEIEGRNSVSGSDLLSPIAKRIKTAFRPEFHVSKGRFRESLFAFIQKLLTCSLFCTDGAPGSFDFEKSLRFQKVLQGQEIFSYKNHPSEIIGSKNSIISLLRSDIRNLYGEAFQSNEVLQGQEILYNNSMHPSSVLHFQNAICQPTYSHPINVTNNFGTPNFGQGYLVQSNISSLLKEKSLYPNPNLNLNPNQSHIGPQESVSMCKTSCRLFGFSLTEGMSQHSTEQGPIVTAKLGGSCINKRVHQWCIATDSCLQGL